MKIDIFKSKYTFIGAGNMAEAIIQGYLWGEIKNDEKNIFIVEPSIERLNYMTSTYGIRGSSEYIEDFDIGTPVLAIKPLVFREIWPNLKKKIPAKSGIISIMAGVSCEEIEGDDDIDVVRIMPNTPCLISKGISAICQKEYNEKAYLESSTFLFAEYLMKGSGEVVHISEEKMHAVTALSGSGPAYAFYFIEAMIKSGKKLGLNDNEANILAKATLAGASQMALESKDNPSVLRERVTSKGGTTEQAINSFVSNNFEDIIHGAMLNAYKKSQELSSG